MCSEEVRITGSRQFSELQCDRLIVQGACTVDSDSRIISVDVTGTLVVEGKLLVKDLTVSGSLRVTNGITADDATITSSIHAKDGNKIERLVMSGDGKICNTDISQIYDSRGVVGEDIRASKLVFGGESESSSD